MDPLGLACTPKINERHIVDGEINRRGKAVGYHHRPNGVDAPKARLTNIVKSSDSSGVYTGMIEILDSTSGKWVPKGVPSTFFPDIWSKSKVISEIRAAFSNKTMIGENQWRGISNSGVIIQGYLDKVGNISTAHPIIGK